MHKLAHATTRDMPLVITSFFGKYDSDTVYEHTEIELVPVTVDSGCLYISLQPMHHHRIP